jgi:hypothetical protein
MLVDNVAVNDFVTLRAVEAVDKRLERRGLVFSRRKAFVETIEPAPRCLEPIV